MVAVVSDKASGQSVTVPDADIVVSRPSIIKLNLAPSDVSSMSRAGNDLIINLEAGGQLRVQGFYTGTGDERSELQLQDASGKVWTGEYTDALADFQFDPAAAVDQLAGGATGGGASGLGAGLAILAGALAVGVGVASSGGSGGGDNNSDPDPDTGAPGAPGLTVGNGSDNLLNSSEVANGSVTVTVNLAGTGAVAGDTLTVNGVTTVLTAAQIAAGVAQTTVMAPANGSTLTVTASLTDAEGNTSPVTTISALVDTTAPGAASMTLGDGDNVIGSGEITNGNVTLNVSLTGTGAVAGDTLTVNGVTTVLTAAQIIAGAAQTTVPVLADGQTMTITASLTDAAGNISPITTITARVDTTAPTAPGVSLGNGDNTIVAGELVNGGVPVRVTLSGTGAVEGDKLIVNGTTTVLTAGQIAAGVAETSVPAPPNGQTLTVTASLTDAAGNNSPATTATAQINTNLLGTPVVTLGDGDEFINAEEINAGQVTVSVSLVGTGAVDGDTLIVNGVSTTITAAQILAGVATTTVNALPEGQTLLVTASLASPGGTSSPIVTVSAEVDTVAPIAPGLSVGNGDAFIGSDEVTNGQVTVLVNISGTNAKAGDTLTVNGVTTTLTANDIAIGSAIATLTVPANGQLLVTASLTDAAGNTSAPATFTAAVDTAAPGAPTLVLGDGVGAIGIDEIVNSLVTVRVNIGNTGAQAGDKIVVNGVTTTLTASDITSGFATTTVTAPANGETLAVTAVLTDLAGNTSPEANASALVDTVAPTTPGISVGNGDAVINSSEVVNGLVTVSVNIAGTGAQAGDTLTVNSVTTTLSANDIATGIATATVTAPANGQPLLVTASLTDAAGNTSPPATFTATVDTAAPGAPTLVLGDGVGAIGIGEITNGLVTVRVNIGTTGAVAGDKLIVNGVTTTLTANDITSGFATTTVTAPQNGTILTVTAALADAAGNTSPVVTASAGIDTTPPGLATVTVGNGDGFITAVEVIGGRVTVSVNLTGTGAVEGDKLTINNVTTTLTANDILTGVATATIAAPVEGASLTVTTSLTDAAGNTSPPSSLTVVMDTTPPGVPGVSLGDGDPTILAGELVNGAVPVTINLIGTNAAIGDKLTVNGAIIILTETHIADASVTTSVTTPPNGALLNVNATLTDAAGNESTPGTASATIATNLLGAPTIIIGDGDGFINAGEINLDNVSVSVSIVGTGAKLNDILTINGIQTVLTAAHISAGVVLTALPAPADGLTLTVNATLSDPLGPTSPTVSVSAQVDTDIPGTPTLTLGNGDAYINASEVNAGFVSVRVGLGGTGAEVGDKLTVNGVTIVLSAAQVGAGEVITTIPALANGQALSVTASLTDSAGNTSPAATASATMDVTPPGLPTVTLGNGDELIGSPEIVGGRVNVSVNLNGTGAAEGDTLTVNGVASILTAAQIQAGVATTTVGAPGNGGILSVDVSITDIANNTSPIVNATATVDITAPGQASVSIGNGDGFIGASEISGGLVTVSVSLAGTNAVAGDRLTVNGVTTILTGAQITAGLAQTTLPVPANGLPLLVTASITDAAGNASLPATASAVVDTVLPGTPSLTVGNGDALIGSSEIVNGQVTVSVNLAGTGAAIGDRLIINGVTTVLDSTQIGSNLVTTTVGVPVNGQPLTVSASLTDPAGNVSPAATFTAVVDTVAPTTPTITLGNGVGPLGISEVAGGLVTVRVGLGTTGAVAGDKLTINGTTTILTAAQISTGFATVTVAAPPNGATLAVTATITDAAGNASPVASASAVVDTTAPGIPVMSIGNGDGFINATEANGGTVTIRVALTGTGAVAGDTLTVNGAPIVLATADITAGFVNVPAAVPVEGATLIVTGSLTDAAGNSSAIATLNVVVDTTPPGLPGVSLGSDGNGTILIGELVDGAVPVSVSLAGTNAAVGDTLTVNGATITLNATHIANQQVVTSVTTPQNGVTLNVSASLTDAAGNTSLPGTATAVIATNLLGAPTITLGNGDAFIGTSELTLGRATVTVSLNGTGAAAGTTLIVNGVSTVLTPADITTGSVTTTVLAPANGQTLTVTASLLDPLGPVSPSVSVSALVDTTAPGAPGVTLGNGDAYINASEVSGGAIAVRINLTGTGAVAGDTLTVNGVVTVLTAAQIAANQVITSVPTIPTGQVVSVSATLKDAAGNTSTVGTSTALVDTTPPGLPAVTLGNGDGLIGSPEIVAGRVTVSVNLAGTGAVVGDTLTVNGVSSIITAAQFLAGVATTTVLAPANGATLSVNASVTDAAGNTSPVANASALVDTVAPGVVGLTIGNGDNFVNASEVVAGRVAVAISLTGSNAAAGDTLTVNGAAIVLTAAQISAGVVNTTVTAPASGATLAVSAALTDAAGNVATAVSASALVDTTPPPVPIVTFQSDTGTVGDGISTNGTILVNGIEAGGRWEYSLNGGTTWTTGSGTSFALGVGNYANVLVRQTDLAGNSATKTLGPVRIFDLVAVDDVATINLNVASTTYAHPKQSGAAGAVLGLGLLGDTVNLSVLGSQSPVQFSVAKNTTQDVSLKGGGAALASLNLLGEQNYDLFIYRVADGQNQAQVFYKYTDWLTFNPGILGILLPSWSAASTPIPQFTGGATYYVVLGNGTAVLNLSLLANLTVETTSNIIHDYSNVSGTLTGNVLTGDTLVSGTIVSGIEATTVVAGGTSIHGTYGTLSISQTGAYTYTADPHFTATSGVQDVFTYTITAPDGSTDTATLTITVGYPGSGGQSLMASVSQETAADDVIAFALADDHQVAPDGSDTTDHPAPGIDTSVAVAPDGTDGSPVTDAAATPDGTELASSDLALDGLLSDTSHHEVDLSALTSSGGEDGSTPAFEDTGSSGIAPSPTLADIPETTPVDPFVPLHHDDQNSNLPVV